MILRESIRSILKSKVLTAVIILQLIVTSFVCNLVFDKLSSMNKSLDKLDQATQKSYFWIVENLFDNDLERRFWKSENSHQRIRSYYEEMAASDEFNYLEFCNQHIWIKDSNSEFIEKSNKSVNLECLNEFGVNVLEGRLFTEDEMDIDFTTQTIPILLGYNLRGQHQIGDVLEGKYMLKDFNFKVIGILDRNSYIIKTNIEEDNVRDFYYEYLDGSYVTPLVNCMDTPKNDDEGFFIRILYMFKLNGIIAAPAGYNAGEIQAKMDNLANKYDMYNFNVIRMSNEQLSMLKLVSKDSIDIMAVLAAIIFIFSLISLFAIMSVKINKNIGHYAIHLMVGASRQRIILYILVEILIILLISHGFSYLVTIRIFSTRVHYTLAWTIASLLAFVAATIPSIHQIMKKELDTLLLGDSYE